MKLTDIVENEGPKVTYRENGDKSHNVRIEYPNGRIHVHTNKKRSELEKIVKARHTPQRK